MNVQLDPLSQASRSNQHPVHNQGGKKKKSRLNTRGTARKAEEIGTMRRWEPALRTHVECLELSAPNLHQP